MEHVLLALGDLQRYREQQQEVNNTNSTIYYQHAQAICPRDGLPFSRLALVILLLLPALQFFFSFEYLLLCTFAVNIYVYRVLLLLLN